MTHRTLSIALLLGVFATACTSQENVKFPNARAGSKSGGTVAVGITQPGSIEPTNAYEPSGSLVVRTMCDPLIQLDPVTGDLRPAIAESWQVADGGRRFTIKLRKGVRFHDGSELTAEDVIFSLSRVASADYAGLLANLMEPVVGFEQVHGDEPASDERFEKQMRGLRVIDTHSFEIQLKRRYSDFLRILTHPLAYPLSKRAVVNGDEQSSKEPVCAGPYRMAEPWEPGKPVLRLVRFPSYYAKNLAFTAGGRGYVDTIEFRILSNNEAGLAEFQAGHVDVARVPHSAQAPESSGTHLVRATNSMLDYVGLPTNESPFDKRAVRVALSQALDREQIVQEVFAGRRAVATGFLPPTLGRIYREEACARNAPVRADVAAAVKNLESTGTDLKGKKIKLYFNDEFEHRRLKESVAAQWRTRLGLEPELVGLSWDQYLAKAQSQEGPDGPFRMSWAPPILSPDGYLHSLFHSRSIGRDNFSGFSDPRFDKSLDDLARRASTEEERVIEYRNLEDIACEQMPIIPVTWGINHFLVNRQKVETAVSEYVELAYGEISLREIYLR